MSETALPRDASSEDGDFEKRVEVLEKDDTEQIARGAVLAPDKLDHQGDFLRADTISDLRENWTQRVESGDALPGVMHAVFPRDAMNLVEDRQLDAPETIGDKTLPAGTWIQGWRYDDEKLWELVADGVLGGFSIGGTAKGRVYEAGELPDDVSIPDEVQAELDEADVTRDEIRAREITSGRIMETSTVDRPAVPLAVHAETKGLAKAAPALTENIVQARLYLEARGHDPDDAKRLAEFLQTHKATEADAPSGFLGKARSWLGGGRDEPTDASTTKDGRTLSAENVESAKAVHDAALDLLNRSDVDHGRRRFTDDRTDEFSIGAYGRDVESSAGGPVESDAGTDTTDNSTTDPSDADNDDSNSTTETTTMSDNIEETLGEITERLDDIEAQLDDGDADAETEEKTTDDGDIDDGPSTEEKVDELAGAIAQMGEQVEQMANAQGVSQQADPGESADEKESTWANSPFAPAGW
ncbi:XkdF-like putative serine protease domain-containing protein [Halorubrum sp. HHNYT27]|uniref:XkdF-like putative serine protease domain-containing protein n=1 Tax=Halorubrum sp. HHNYT27 TaxID=3402275 RepID=UPI003EBA0D15